MFHPPERIYYLLLFDACLSRDWKKIQFEDWKNKLFQIEIVLQDSTN